MQQSKYELPKLQQDEIIGQPPAWLSRYGTVLLFGILLLLLAFAFIFKFPDTIKGSVSITTSTPPVTLMAPSTGKLVRLFVTDNQAVEPQQPLILLENAANYDAIVKLQELLELNSGNNAKTVATKNELNLMDTLKQGKLQLGDLQNSFNAYVSAFDKLQFYSKEKSSFKKLAILEGELMNYTSLNNQLFEQLDVIKKKLDIMKTKLDRDGQLYQEKVISQQDLDNTQKLYYDQQIQYKSVIASVTQNKLVVQEVNKKIIEIEQDANFKKDDNFIELESSLNQLRSDYYKWEQHYLIKSPMKGKVSFFKFWSENQHITAGESVISVTNGEQETIGKALVSIRNSGKLKVGQEVKIKLDNYPYLEFGILKGKIKSISNIPQDNHYAIDIYLPDGLQTTYHKTLTGQQEMKGQAEIIIEDMRLIERIFYQFKNLFQNQ